MTPFATSRALWYLTRASGAVSLLLLTAVLLLGVLGPARIATGGRWPRFVVGSLHRDLSLLAVAVLAVHIVTSVLDPFAPIGWLDAVLPLHSSYRSIWVGLGALAFDLLVALVLTSLVRRRLGYERWRWVHWTAYACWPVAVLHGLGTGSDAGTAWLVWLTAACVIAAVLAVLVRVQRTHGMPERARAGGAALTLATALGIAVFALLGPLQSGWAARAGTPVDLLGHHVTASRTATTTTVHSFAAEVRGTLRQSAAPGGRIIDLDLALTGGEAGTLRVRLGGRPVGAGGLSLIGSQVDLSAPALGGVMAGRVVALRGTVLRAQLVQSTGSRWTVDVSLRVDAFRGTVTGRLDGTSTRP